MAKEQIKKDEKVVEPTTEPITEPTTELAKPPTAVPDNCTLISSLAVTSNICYNGHPLRVAPYGRVSNVKRSLLGSLPAGLVLV